MFTRFLTLVIAALIFSSVSSESGKNTSIKGDHNSVGDTHITDHQHDQDHDTLDHGHHEDHVGHKHYHEEHVLSFEGHNRLHHNSSWSLTLPGYDIRDRPHSKISAQEPVHVDVYGHINFIETIDETEGEIVAAIFFTIKWKDNRLKPFDVIAKEDNIEENKHVVFPGEVKHKLWLPDLYMPTARRVNVPVIKQPAECIRVGRNNTIEFVGFFVIAFKCKLNYSHFPLDDQDCNLDIMSYAHDNRYLRLTWTKPGLYGIRSAATKHFHVRIYRPKGHSQFIQSFKDGDKDVLRIKFHLKRHNSFHILQTYLPSIMLVFIGWLSMLVPLDYAYGRMVLSVTTLLVLVSIFVTTSQDTPGVNEVKALDVWLFMCIFFVFSAIVNCILDLRLLSMVEKESQIAGEYREDQLGPPVVDEQIRRTSQGAREASPTRVLVAPESKFSVVFHGRNTPFQAGKEALIATPTVIKWLRLAIMVERVMAVTYPAFFALFLAAYWAIYMARSHIVTEPEDDFPPL